MLIDEALRAHFLSKTKITSIVSSRVYEIVAPQKADYPHLTFNRAAGSGRVRSLKGPSGLTRAVFHAHSWGKKPSESQNLSENVRLVLDGFKGIMGGPGGVYCGACFVEDDIDTFDDQAFAFHTVRQIVIWHNETVPNETFT